MAENIDILIRAKDDASKAFANIGKVAQKEFEKVQKAAKFVSVAFAGFATAALYNFANTGEELQKFAVSSGVAAEAAGAMKLVAQEMGLSLGTVGTAIKKMQVNLSAMAEDTKKADDKLKPLGLTFSQIQNLKPEEQLFAIGNALAGLSDPAKKTALSMEFMGKAGSSLLPFFEEGNLSIEQFKEKAKELGLSFDELSLKKAAELDNALDGLQSAIGGVSQQVAAALAPSITQIINDLGPLIKGISEWIAKNPELAETIFKVGTAITLALSSNPIVASIGIIIGTMALLDGKLKEAGLAWEDFGILVKIVWDEFVLNATTAIGQIQMGMAALAGAPKPVLDEMNKIFQEETATLKAQVDKDYLELNQNMEKRMEAGKIAVEDKLAILKDQAALATGAMKDELLAKYDALKTESIAKFGELSLGTTAELAEMRSAAAAELESMKASFSNILGELASAAVSWGANFVESYRGGILQKIPLLQTAVNQLKNIIKQSHQSYNPELPAQTWGSHFIENYVSGINAKMQQLQTATSGVISTLSGTDIRTPAMATSAIPAPQAAEIGGGNGINFNFGNISISKAVDGEAFLNDMERRLTRIIQLQGLGSVR